MQKTIRCFRIAEYIVLVFETLPRDFSKVKINGMTYEVLIPYDVPNSIAIKSNENFNDNIVEFI